MPDVALTAGGAAASPTRRPRGRPGHNRAAVLVGAVELFNQRGYDATSIGDIARALGVTKPAIFHHFDSKEAILAAALDEALGKLDEVLASADPAANPYQRLRETVAAAVRILTAYLPEVTLLLRVRGNSPMQQQAVQRRRDIDDQLVDLVKAAAAQGCLRSDIEPDILARLMFGTVNSLADWYRVDGVLDSEALAATVTMFLFDGLARPAATAS
jgi:AcrR family transcriptional regulator